MPAVEGLRRDLEILAGTNGSEDPREVYDGVANRYDRFRSLWLRHAGAPAEHTMLADLRSVLRPGARVLDAGCGTGALSRQILEISPDVRLTLLDLSPDMLSRTADVDAEARVEGSVLAMPFDRDSFDVVVAAWVIETVPDPAAAVAEMLRVLAPGGALVYTFCSLPDGFFSRAGSAWLRSAVRRGFAGSFLPTESTPWHECPDSHLVRFTHGLVTEVLLRSCCTIGSAALPRTEPA